MSFVPGRGAGPRGTRPLRPPQPLVPTADSQAMLRSLRADGQSVTLTVAANQTVEISFGTLTSSLRERLVVVLNDKDSGRRYGNLEILRDFLYEKYDGIAEQVAFFYSAIEDTIGYDNLRRLAYEQGAGRSFMVGNRWDVLQKTAASWRDRDQKKAEAARRLAGLVSKDFIQELTHWGLTSDNLQIITRCLEGWPEVGKFNRAGTRDKKNLHVREAVYRKVYNRLMAIDKPLQRRLTKTNVLPRDVQDVWEDLKAHAKTKMGPLRTDILTKEELRALNKHHLKLDGRSFGLASGNGMIFEWVPTDHWLIDNFFYRPSPAQFKPIDPFFHMEQTKNAVDLSEVYRLVNERDRQGKAETVVSESPTPQKTAAEPPLEPVGPEESPKVSPAPPRASPAPAPLRTSPAPSRASTRLSSVLSDIGDAMDFEMTPTPDRPRRSERKDYSHMTTGTARKTSRAEEKPQASPSTPVKTPPKPKAKVLVVPQPEMVHNAVDMLTLESKLRYSDAFKQLHDGKSLSIGPQASVSVDSTQRMLGNKTQEPDNRWLDDEQIHEGLMSLAVRSVPNPPLLFGSTVYHVWVSQGYQWQHVAKEVRTTAGNMLVPIHVDSNHWILVYLDFNNRILYYMDSMEDPSRRQRIVAQIRELLKSLHTNAPGVWPDLNIGLQESPLRSGQQETAYDCGLFVIDNARHLVRGLTPNSQFAREALYLRGLLLETFMNNSRLMGEQAQNRHNRLKSELEVMLEELNATYNLNVALKDIQKYFHK